MENDWLRRILPFDNDVFIVRLLALLYKPIKVPDLSTKTQQLEQLT